MRNMSSGNTCGWNTVVPTNFFSCVPQKEVFGFYCCTIRKEISSKFPRLALYFTLQEMITSEKWQPSYKYILIGFVEFILLMGIFLIILNYNFDSTLGFKNDCINKDGTKDECYCEAFSDASLVKQPINTYSALSFIVVGFVILGTLTQNVPSKNLVRSSSWFPATYAYVVIFMAQGSMCFHGSMTGTGGFFDTLSMNMWVNYAITFDILRLLPLRPVIGIPLWLFLVLFCAVLQELIRGSTLFTSLVVFVLLLECIVLYRLWKTVSTRKWLQSFFPLGLAVVVFAIAYTVWNLSHTGSVLCWSKSIFQGHGVWHVLCAAVTGLVYLYVYFGIDPPKIRIPERFYFAGLCSIEEHDDELVAIV